MNERMQSLLRRRVDYQGDKMDVTALEKNIHAVRNNQNQKVSQLVTLRNRQSEIQQALSTEMHKLQDVSKLLQQSQDSFWNGLKKRLGFSPIEKKRRSIENLLRTQYELSAVRVKEASEYADQLRMAQSDMFDEIEALNKKIIEAAKNEETAAAFILDLKQGLDLLEVQLAQATYGTAEQRELEGQRDELQRTLFEHSQLMQLYQTSEERMARLKDNSQLLLETLGNLSADVTHYVTAAGAKLDLVASQIQAVGTAADASLVLLEMKQSLDVLSASMNQTTQFVSATQLFLRKNIDSMLKDLEVYDAATEEVLQKNLIAGRTIEERRISKAVASAKERRIMAELERGEHTGPTRSL